MDVIAVYRFCRYVIIQMGNLFYVTEIRIHIRDMWENIPTTGKRSPSNIVTASQVPYIKVA